MACTVTLSALEYPGTAPGKSRCEITADHAVLENAVIRGTWKLEHEHITSFTLDHKQTGQIIRLDSGHFPAVKLGTGRTIELASLKPSTPLRVEKGTLNCHFADAESGLKFSWSASLKDGANAIVQQLTTEATADTAIEGLVFLDARIPEVRQVGQVSGSVVVCGDAFLAVEHPLAKNTVEADCRVGCRLPRGNTLKAGQSWSRGFATGVVPPGQLRRGFLHYLEQHRARPYQPFLHYNNWYDVRLGQAMEQRSTEAECMETIRIFARELVHKRGVRMDGFVWDDGWDDFDTLWRFHKGFPAGFQNLHAFAGEFGASMGVWMSPWGGYASAKDKRIAYGISQGYETNDSGFSMAGPNYAKAFREVCLDMARQQGVRFFKFDGMGGGDLSSGAEGKLADDVDAVLSLGKILRDENPEVFISTTVGTWPSPFWTFYADSIWRQGHDMGWSGEGNTREQWINYRDTMTHERIVQAGPLYPLNSLMTLGPTLCDRKGRTPARAVLDEESVANEIWSFFGSGTQTQELYVNPHLPTQEMWNQLAAAAKWARANADVLVDTHWIGGSPAAGEVYGWASWQPHKGILALRNPSETPQDFAITPRLALELPAGLTGTMTLEAVYPSQRKLPVDTVKPDQPLHFHLQPFEVVVIELLPGKPE